MAQTSALSPRTTAAQHQHPGEMVDARLMRSRAEQLRRQANLMPELAATAFQRRACEIDLVATVIG